MQAESRGIVENASTQGYTRVFKTLLAVSIWDLPGGICAQGWVWWEQGL